jgi:hypothetical protein
MNNGSLSLLKDLQLPLSVDERALLRYHGRDRLIQSYKGPIALVDVTRREKMQLSMPFKR